jgi:hypothetical protein
MDGLSEREFILKAHVLTWSGDIPALSKCLNLSGHNSYKGCRFCHIQGVCHELNNHVYFPQAIASELRTHEGTLDMMNKIDKEECKRLKDDMIKKSGNINYYKYWLDIISQKFYYPYSILLFFYVGIKGSSEILKLKSLKFPWPFPTDIMHLFFENVGPQMYSHWSNNFFKNIYSNDNYVLSKSELEKIGKQMESLKNEMSSEIGRPSRDILKYHNGFKAVEWKNWITLFSLPLLRQYFVERCCIL